MQPLPGFRDFLPENCAARNYIFDCWRKVARRYGFVEWDGPILEPTELYTKKSGPEIVAQLFNFSDKGDREVAMRPELTPTLARVVAAHDREFKKPLKWFSIPQCFRYEKQQRGRLREHFQFNADIIGESTVEADAELIALCIDLLRAFGISENIRVEISDRRAWQEFLPKLGITAEQTPEFLNIIDKWPRTTEEVITKRLGQFGVSVADIVNFTAAANVQWFAPLRENLEARGLLSFCQFNLQIVRGLAYYTGVVFEVFDTANKFRAIAGGGRYDNLIEQLSGGAPSLPAAGFAMGDVVLAELIDEIPSAKEEMAKAVAAQRELDIYIVIAKEERRPDALAQIQLLRDAGRRVDYPLAPAKVGKQLQTAEQLGARVAILFGDEWPEVKVKDLQTGEQRLVPSEIIRQAMEEIFRRFVP